MRFVDVDVFCIVLLTYPCIGSKCIISFVPGLFEKQSFFSPRIFPIIHLLTSPHTHTTTISTISAAYLSINVVIFFLWNAKSMRSFTLVLADHIENTHSHSVLERNVPVVCLCMLIRAQISHVLRETHAENV